MNSKLWVLLLTEALEMRADRSANVMHICRELKYYTIPLNQRELQEANNEDEVMLRVLAFYSELKKCITKYILRIGHRKHKRKVEERGKALYWTGKGELERRREAVP